MSAITTVLALVLFMILLLILGVPIGYTFFIIGFLGIGLHLGPSQSLSLMRQTVYSESQNYLLASIPMFVLMAIVLDESGLLQEIFEAMDSWTKGVFPGGLAIGTTFANGAFAAMSGSSTAAAAAFAKIARPNMKEFGYSDELTMGTIAASGTFAMMFPPSIALIIYGILTETSIGQLFIAGMVPGILTALAYVLVIVAWVKYNPSISGQTPEPDSWGRRIELSKPLIPALMLILFILGGLYFGVVTAVEAGAFGAAGAIILSVVLYDLRLDGLLKAANETLRITTFIFIVIIGAMYFSTYIALTGLVTDLIQLVTSLNIGMYPLLGILVLCYIFLGMFMNQIAILVLTLPITYPTMVDGFGMHPLLFGIVIIKTVEIGMVTPPLGLNVYVASSAVNIDPWITFKGAARFIFPDLLILMLLVAFPVLVLYLPGLMF
jgi:C4-dicarboxylate transporter DctM subunit